MELPQVNHVGPQAAQAVLQLLPGAGGGARSHLGHQENILPLAGC